MSGVLGRFISYMRNRIFRKYYFIKLFVFTILEAAITFSFTASINVSLSRSSSEGEGPKSDLFMTVITPAHDNVSIHSLTLFSLSDLFKRIF